MERVKTGIPGFDELIEGGIPEGFNVLVTGTPGTGKTIFGLQYLYNGAMNGENGVYITLDAKKAELIEQAKLFGWDLEALEKAGKISILEISLNKVDMDLFEMIDEEVQNVKAKRLVFDSLINFAINIDQFKVPVSFSVSNAEVADVMGNKTYYQGKSEKRVTYLLVDKLARLKTTNIIITAAPQDSSALTSDGVSEFASDGVIIMGVHEIARKTVRGIKIEKLRNTHQKLGWSLLDVLENGLRIKQEDIFEGAKITGISP